MISLYNLNLKNVGYLGLRYTLHPKGYSAAELQASILEVS